ncbi:MAG: ABC transporter substrate-binding protein [Cyclonatronaceae bacterium]
MPAATQMIYDMRLDHLLEGVTFECFAQALAEKQKVVRCVMEDKTYSSEEIDRIFSASKAEGKSLYYVDEGVLQNIAPDIIFTQDVCEVCQIDTTCTTAAVEKLPHTPELVPLSPNSLREAFDCALRIADTLGNREAGLRYLSGLQNRIDGIKHMLQKAEKIPQRVLLLEWIEPIFNCGHWIPHQIACAGGVDQLSRPSGDSVVLSWEKIRAYDPEVLVVAPCGFHVQRAKEEMHLLQRRPGFETLTAVKENKVYLADFDLFTQPSASTLTKGIELLAALFHPDMFKVPDSLKHKYMHWDTAAIDV